MRNEMEEARKHFLKQRLKDDILSADLQWSLMVAALSSYRHDSVLRPFPPMFIDDSHNHKNYSALEKLCDKVENLQVLAQNLADVDSKIIELLYWTLNAKNFTIKSCSKEKYSMIQELTGQVTPAPTPNFVFEVVYSKSLQEKFEDLRAGRDLIYAYHGSRIENFYSILHHGLTAHLNKQSLFGEGTYLSSELAVSLTYSPGGKSWDCSALGSSLSCIAMCEVIDDDSVKCQVKDKKDSSNNGGHSRSHIPGSIGGQVPEKYYVVRNNEMIRVKYLLIYTAQKQKRRSEKWEWILKHRFVLTMAFYVMLLFILGLYNSKIFRTYLRRYITW